MGMGGWWGGPWKKSVSKLVPSINSNHFNLHFSQLLVKNSLIAPFIGCTDM